MTAVERTYVGYAPTRPPATADTIQERTISALLPNLETATDEDLLGLAHRCCVDSDERWVLLGSDSHVLALLALIDRRTESLNELSALLGTATARLAIAQGLAGRREQMMTEARAAHESTALELATARESAARFDETTMRLSMRLATAEQLRTSALEDCNQLRKQCIALSEENRLLKLAGGRPL